MKLITLVAFSFLLVVLTAVAYPCFAAEPTEQQKLLAAQSLAVYDRKVIMRGMGLTQLVNGDYYIGAFYMDEDSSYANEEDLAHLETARSMCFQFVSENKISARSFKNKLAESIRINNTKEDIKPQAKNVAQLLKLFKGTLKKGDQIRFDYHNKRGTMVYYNDRLLGTFKRSAALYKLLLSSWIGERPPSNKFKQGIMGGNDNAYANQLLHRFVFVD